MPASEPAERPHGLDGEMFLFAPIRWAFKLVYFAVLAAVVYVLVSAYQVVSASHLPTSPTAVTSAQAIVVLGAPAVSTPLGVQPGSDYHARLAQALALYRAHEAPEVVVAGTPAAIGSPAEVPVGTSWLVGSGVARSSITDVVADDAASALSQVASLLPARAKVIVVTDAIDALWTKGAGSKTGLVVQVSPAQGSERAFYQEFDQLWRQATGVAVGRLIGYVNTPWAAG